MKWLRELGLHQLVVAAGGPAHLSSESPDSHGAQVSSAFIKNQQGLVPVGLIF
jgi:hypothetical protein